MKNWTKLALGLAASISALTGAATHARADDTKHYIAALCQENGNGESGAMFRNEGLVTRSGNFGSGRLICPITRDNNGRIKIEAFVNDNMPDLTGNTFLDNVSCSVSVRNTDGSPIAFQTLFTVGALRTTRVLSPQLSSVVNDRPWSIECTLPPNSGAGTAALHSFKVTEIF